MGQGEWSDKIGAGALGWFIAWPLAVTAGVGAYKQKKLPEEIFQVIEQCIVSGGRSVVVRNAGAELNAGMVVCPACKTQCAAGAKFCNNCGAKLENKCPQCGVSRPIICGQYKKALVGNIEFLVGEASCQRRLSSL